MSSVHRETPGSSTSPPTKKAAAERAKAMLREYSGGQDLSPEDQAAAIDLFLKHPAASRKLAEVVSVVVDREPQFGGSCFWIVGRGEQRVDFSYRKCLTPPTDAADFSAACRQEVADAVIAFKQGAFKEGMLCPITGEVLTWETADVDHASPHTFAAMVHSFIDQGGIDLGSVEYDHSGIGVCFADKHLALRWYFYHDDCAVLRLVSAYANRVLLRTA